LEIDDSKRSIIRDIANCARRAQESEEGSAREECAKDKLRAKLAILKHQGKAPPSMALVLENMRVLGMRRESKTGHKRKAALTSWMDRAKGDSHGGSWSTPVRAGACSDSASRALAAALAKLPAPSSPDASPTCLPCGEGTAWRALRNWRANPGVDDLPRAKACGHNETAMFFLRPFHPLEVLNTRVCSLAAPAPDNCGFEGCLEFLSRVCAAAERGVAFWDAEVFAYVDGSAPVGDRATVHYLRKESFLFLPAPKLAWLVTVMRQWTLFRFHVSRRGCPPRALVKGIDHALRIACFAASPAGRDAPRDYPPEFHSLPARVVCRVMSFVFPGSPADWSSFRTIDV